MADLIPYDDRDGVIWFDGALVPWRDAKLHVLSHGLHYASCVFEGERVYDGRIFKVEEHTQRLLDSAERAGIRDPLQPRGRWLTPPGSWSRNSASAMATCGRSPGAGPR